ncbi:unnamed protein product [Anisakis simplex]|uniref:Uncharacterized protein n=1 Tax=Anisakis simplex TaxID=6269 RepID=A0A0M3KHI0_ANISI|nr:unnamed protein product [Anisakis simplex]
MQRVISRKRRSNQRQLANAANNNSPALKSARLGNNIAEENGNCGSLEALMAASEQFKVLFNSNSGMEEELDAASSSSMELAALLANATLNRSMLEKIYETMLSSCQAGPSYTPIASTSEHALSPEHLEIELDNVISFIFFSTVFIFVFNQMNR